jgi:hypothetical protein
MTTRRTKGATNDNVPDKTAIIRDQGMTLVTIDDCMPITVGQRLKTFRGEVCFAISGRAPHKPGSTGRIAVKMEDVDTPTEFFPGVVQARWINDDSLEAILAAAGDKLH